VRTLGEVRRVKLSWTAGEDMMIIKLDYFCWWVGLEKASMQGVQVQRLTELTSNRFDLIQWIANLQQMNVSRSIRFNRNFRKCRSQGLLEAKKFNQKISVDGTD
jgi:hypothetical protein